LITDCLRVRIAAAVEGGHDAALRGHRWRELPRATMGHRNPTRELSRSDEKPIMMENKGSQVRGKHGEDAPPGRP
jgi:hypothetical protein